MRFTLQQSVFTGAINSVIRAVSTTRPSHPILACVLIKADAANQTVMFTGFDLSLGIQTIAPAQVELGGEITVPAKLIGDIVSRLDDVPVLVEQDGESIKLKTLSGDYNLQTFPPGDYPELPQIKGTPFSIPSKTLCDGFRPTLPSVSNEETKAVLCGVNIRTEPDSIHFAATDGHRMTRVILPFEGTLEQVTIPTYAVREIERLAAGCEALEVIFDNGLAQFKSELQTLTTRLLDGNYPNYPQLIPTEFARTITVNRKGLITALGRVAVLIEQKANVVKLHVEPGRMTLSDQHGSGRETLPIELLQGEPITICFNVRYLMDGLRIIQSEQVIIQLNKETTPVILTPSDDFDMLYLLMPIQLKE